jgi:hypothetical protein
METTPFLLSPPVYLCPFFASDLIIYEIVPDGKKAHSGVAFFANWRQLNYILASHHVRAVGRIASPLTPWHSAVEWRF